MTRARKNKGRILFVGTGPGDPDLLTEGAREALASAQVVISDADVPEPIHALAEVEVVVNEDEPTVVGKTLVAEAKLGQVVVRLVAGDPLASESVTKEIQTVSRSAVTWRVIAAVSGRTAIPSYAGIATGPLTSYADLTEEGADTQLAALAATAWPLVLSTRLESLKSVAKALIEGGRSADSHAAVTVNGTRLSQKTVTGHLSGLVDGTLDVKSLEGPVTLVIGKPVAQQGKYSWWEKRALYGWQVLVPRTKDQAGDMSELLRDHGAIPIEVPTIAVEPPRTPAQMERAIKGLVNGRYSWIVFTSTNAVKAVWEKFTEFGLDARAFAGVKIACVGEATADAVRAFGIIPELLPSGEQSSRGLLEDFPPYDDVLDPIDRVLLPRADIATETLSEGLREQGWEIDDVTAYRTVRAAPPAAHIRESIKGGGFDAVCFTSSSTVRNLVGIAGKPHARTVVACIGPATAATAVEFGLRVDVQPETAAIPDVIDALADYAINLREVEGFDRPPRKTKSRAKSRS
ncbi:uroporphyrinogen III methyltransferase/synthase [Antricoccus suffuscus]|uniref:Uroporphyrinogen III methyltransferase/synthase n=1 Tax=Antricoccus suffuscus TaxID=1629062 RepID=A0A2T0ZRT3_9ACTN|nr:uroporphyrinogen-III synthase [Antricoccus suffuscus]PRZ39076.1 uroporphyrinogen III methyltransferase/synthase [Antricoccus suffuscus]